LRGNDAYSAAGANEAFGELLEGALEGVLEGALDEESLEESLGSFGFVADIMKSEMRGTISDLNREPLNTP
jgi:hypothetical protein